MVVVTKTVTAAPAVPDSESELAVADEEGLALDEVDAPIVAETVADVIVDDDPPPVPEELAAVLDVAVADAEELVAAELEAVKLDDAAGPREEPRTVVVV